MTDPMVLIPGTPEWYENRKSCVAASECPLIMGIPVYGGRTVSDLWYEKRYGIEKASKGNASTDMGTELEPVVLRYAESKLGTIVDRQKWFALGPNGGTLDGRVEESGAIVEAKTSGVLGPSKANLWGPDDSDEVPDQYLIQVSCQLLVTGAEMAYLAALIGGRGFAMFQIKPDKNLQSFIIEKSNEFLKTLAEDIAPEEPPQLETLKRIRRDPGKVLDRSDRTDELWERLSEAKASAKASEEVKELAERHWYAAMGDADGVRVEGGLFTYLERTVHYKSKLASEATFRYPMFKKGG
jgi:putative phage-type endonuclease